MQGSGRVIPIEVKAQENVKSKSFSTFINIDHKELSIKGVRFSMLPHIDQGWMENLPLWSVEAWSRKICRTI